MTPGVDAPEVIAPDPATLFLARAKRLEALADRHAIADYLGLMAQLSRIQHELLQTHPEVPLPDAETLRLAHAHAMPPLPANGWKRDPVWREHLARIAGRLAPAASANLRETLAALARTDAGELEALADAVLHTEHLPDDTARLPFVSAALQVYWTWMASRPELDGIRRLDVAGVCPCCGSLPGASVVATGDHAGTRYLHCSLCNTEWNLVRLNCSSCGGTDKVSYKVLESDDQPVHDVVRAEVCDACMSYLKLIHQDKDAQADAVADDLATLALDILVDEAGYARSGPLPLFMPGDPD